MFVCIVNGAPRAGKDTFISFMRDFLTKKGIASSEYSSIAPIKSMLEKAGISLIDKTPADRKLLSVVGDALEEHSNFRTTLCVQKAYEWACKGRVVFLHIREPENIVKVSDSLSDRGIDVHTILIKSDAALKEFSNPSDSSTDGMAYRHEISNDASLGTLYDSAKDLAKFILREGNYFEQSA